MFILHIFLRIRISSGEAIPAWSEIHDITCPDLFYPESLMEGCQCRKFSTMGGEDVPDVLLPEIVDSFFCLAVVFFQMKAAHYPEDPVVPTDFFCMLKGIYYT